MARVHTHTHTHAHMHAHACFLLSHDSGFIRQLRLWVGPCLGRGSSVGASKATVLAFCHSLEPATSQLTVNGTKRNWVLEVEVEGWKITESMHHPHHTPNPFFQKGRRENHEGKRKGYTGNLESWACPYCWLANPVIIIHSLCLATYL